MFDLYIKIHNKNLEVMILYRDVLRTRSHFQRNREFNHPLIVFINCEYIFENKAQYLRGVALNIE